MDVLDFGCGTGLLTLRLQPLVRSITGADSSGGMLDVLNSKIESLGLQNVSTQLLASTDDLTGNYHLVVSNMTLHHIKDVGDILRLLRGVLVPGGYIAVADLDPDRGRFHEHAEGIHHQGFERDELRTLFREAGFEDIRDRTAASVVKPAPDGGEERFSVFLMVGRQSA